MKVKTLLPRLNPDRIKKAKMATAMQTLSASVSREQGRRDSGLRITARIKVPGKFSRSYPDQDGAYYEKLRSVRRFNNRKMPALACSNCAYSSSCPQYKAGFECAFLPFFNSHRISTMDDLIFYLKELATTAVRRAHLTTTMETLSGAAPSLETTEALALASNQLTALHKVMSSGDAEVTVEGDSTFERLFGGLSGLVDKTRGALGVVEANQFVLGNPDPVAQLSGAEKEAHQDLIQEYEPGSASKPTPVVEVVESIIKAL